MVYFPTFTIKHSQIIPNVTLQGTNISPKNGILKRIFLFPRWDGYVSSLEGKHAIHSVFGIVNEIINIGVFRHVFRKNPQSHGSVSSGQTGTKICQESQVPHFLRQ